MKCIYFNSFRNITIVKLSKKHTHRIIGKGQKNKPSHRFTPPSDSISTYPHDNQRLIFELLHS